MNSRRAADFQVEVRDIAAHGVARAAFWSKGLVTFAGVTEGEALLRIAPEIGSVYPHRDATPDGITRIATRTDPGIGGADPVMTPALPLHTDSSGEPEPPVGLMVLCTREPGSGGEALFADGRLIVGELEREYPDVLETLSRPDVAVFRSVGYAAGANAVAGPPIARPIIEALGDHHYALRFRPDPVAFTPGVEDALGVFQSVVARHTFSVAVRRGEGYIVQNDRFLHGRNRAFGERETLRVLVDVERWRLPGRPSRGFRIPD